jgi:hypothetical protein
MALASTEWERILAVVLELNNDHSFPVNVRYDHIHVCGDRTHRVYSLLRYSV